MNRIIKILKELLFYISNYVYRLYFVSKMYTLLIIYGLFSRSEKIVPKKYIENEKFEGNLYHDFRFYKNIPNGIKFHYVTNLNFNTDDTIEEPVFVFLHGIFESWYSWNNQLKYLDKNNIKCIAIDLKNHGNTSSHYSGSVMCELDLGKNFDLTNQGMEIATLINQLKIKNVVFVTSDLGTLICDKLVNQIYCPNVLGWLRCHEPMPAYPNDKGLPQKYLFWFNIKLSLFLMHNSNEMILKLFYRATEWNFVDAVGATYVKINKEETKKCLENSICLYEFGPYKNMNSNYMSWAGAYAYAFLNDIYTGAILNTYSYKSCKFPVWLIHGEFDNSCKLEYVNGEKSLGYKLVNGEFLSKMIKYNGEDNYEFLFLNENENSVKSEAYKPSEYFSNSNNSMVIIHENTGHMSHLENPEMFTNTLEKFVKKILK